MLGNGTDVDEKKYGKWFLYLAYPLAFRWGWLWLNLVSLSVRTGMKHWLWLFKHHRSTGMVICNFRNRPFLSFSGTESNSRDILWCKMKKGLYEARNTPICPFMMDVVGGYNMYPAVGWMGPGSET